MVAEQKGGGSKLWLKGLASTVLTAAGRQEAAGGWQQRGDGALVKSQGRQRCTHTRAVLLLLLSRLGRRRRSLLLLLDGTPAGCLLLLLPLPLLLLRRCWPSSFLHSCCGPWAPAARLLQGRHQRPAARRQAAGAGGDLQAPPAGGWQGCCCLAASCCGAEGAAGPAGRCGGESQSRHGAGVQSSEGRSTQQAGRGQLSLPSTPEGLQGKDQRRSRQQPA